LYHSHDVIAITRKGDLAHRRLPAPNRRMDSLVRHWQPRLQGRPGW